MRSANFYKEEIKLAKQFKNKETDHQEETQVQPNCEDKNSTQHPGLPDPDPKAPDSTITPPSDVNASGSGNTTAQMMSNLAAKVVMKPAASNKTLETDTESVVGVSPSRMKAASGAGSALDTPVDDRSRLPNRTGGNLPSTRQGKLTASIDEKIDNAICEQVIPEYEGADTYDDSSKEKQGYNGNKYYAKPRSLKTLGSAPQALDYDRSIDMVTKDAIIHTTGQVLDSDKHHVTYPTYSATIKGDLLVSADDPSYAVDTDGESQTASKYHHKLKHPLKKSNYLLDGLELTFKGGRLIGIRFLETELPVTTPQKHKGLVNLNWQLDENNVRKLHDELLAKKGDVTESSYSPMSNGIPEPLSWLLLGHDIEATTGPIMLLALRACIFSLAYQSHNKIAKQGNTSAKAMYQMFLEGLGKLSDDFDPSAINQKVFSEKYFELGSAAALIQAFDSTKKYKRRSHIFNFPQSLRQHIISATQEINKFLIKPEFLGALDTAHLFSTEDGKYNPMLPLFATDKIKLVNPLSLNAFLQGWSRTSVDNSNLSGLSDFLSFRYGTDRDDVKRRITHPVVEGLLTWLIRNEESLSDVYNGKMKDSQGNFVEKVITIPAHFSLLGPSMFQFILASATADVVLSRGKVFKEYFKAFDGLNGYSDLISTSESQVTKSSNFTFSDFKSPIIAGRMKDSSFVHFFWGDKFTPVKLTNTNKSKKFSILCPWHYDASIFIKESFDPSDYANGLYKDWERICKMLYPESRIGVNHQLLDRLLAIKPRDLRLMLDRSYGLPAPLRSEAGAPGSSTHMVTNPTPNCRLLCKVTGLGYDDISSCRTIATYYTDRDSDFTTTCLPTYYGILCLPKEVGFLYPDVPFDKIFEHNQGGDLEVISSRTTLNSVINGACSKVIYAYSAAVVGNSIKDLNLSDGLAFSQTKAALFADRALHEYVDSTKTSVTRADFLHKIGWVPSLSALFYKGGSRKPTLTNLAQDLVTINASRDIDSGELLQASASTDIVQFGTLSRVMWGLFSRLVFPQDDFSAVPIPLDPDADGVPQNYTYLDPFEFMFYFGLSGFLSTDYTPDVSERMTLIAQVDNYLTSDNFRDDSLAIK